MIIGLIKNKTIIGLLSLIKEIGQWHGVMEMICEATCIELCISAPYHQCKNQAQP